MAKVNKNILTESFKSNFKTLPNKPANVLKRIQGVLSDFKTNRNGRIYPRELWENVLSSDYVKEMIDSHGLVGELDHPEERLEISLQNVSHVINDMWIEDDKVMGIIDILPTPSGKIVNELLDYGTDIGISSRGAGSVGAGNIVDPDYQFITFDFVARPSCEAARLNTILEGVQYEIDNNTDEKVNAILEGYKTELNEAKENEYQYAVVITSEVGPSQYETTTREIYDDPEQAEDAVAELKAQGIAATVTTIKKSSKDIPEIMCGFIGDLFINMHEDFNSNKESLDLWCEDGGCFTNAGYPKDVCDKLEELMYKVNPYVDNIIDTLSDYDNLYESKKLSEADTITLPSNIGSLVMAVVKDKDELNRELNFVKPNMERVKYWAKELDTDVDNLYNLVNDRVSNKESINESVLSDQDVYKTVLGWYKEQIEQGNMTLNQAYELLSDKAKVSLNKMIDQNKIKESFVETTIDELLKESTELNS